MVNNFAPTPASQKKELRRSLLAQRRALTAEEWRQKSDRICDQLRSLPDFVAAQTVLSYFSTRCEPDLSPLLTLPKRWGFPRCVGGNALSWHQWSPNHPLQTGTFGILEPLADAPTIDSDHVDLILVPSVACDRFGYRLGYGGGFYDRLLVNSAWATKKTIGIVFEFARIPKLPVDPWDRALTAVCTETGLFQAEA